MRRTLSKALVACGCAVALAPVSHATILGFGELGGSNATVPKTYGSDASADSAGVTVSNGATPNIDVTWDILLPDPPESSRGDNGWDIHTSGNFAEIESLTVGGAAWDSATGSPLIGQMDFPYHTIGFSADAGYAVVLNSFDFGNTAETSDIATWELTLMDSSSSVVWSQTVVLDNQGVDALTVTPNFTGEAGEDYILEFEVVEYSAYGNPTGTFPNGRHAIDNVSFNQIAVPEPASLALLALGGLTLVGRRR